MKKKLCADNTSCLFQLGEEEVEGEIDKIIPHQVQKMT